LDIADDDTASFDAYSHIAFEIVDDTASCIQWFRFLLSSTALTLSLSYPLEVGPQLAFFRR